MRKRNLISFKIGNKIRSSPFVHVYLVYKKIGKKSGSSTFAQTERLVLKTKNSGTLKTFAADRQPGDFIRPQGSSALKYNLNKRYVKFMNLTNLSKFYWQSIAENGKEACKSQSCPRLSKSWYLLFLPLPLLLSLSLSLFLFCLLFHCHCHQLATRNAYFKRSV